MTYVRTVLLIVTLLAGIALRADDLTVSGRVELAGRVDHKRTTAATVVVWLTPIQGMPGRNLAEQFAAQPQLQQKDKSFVPHLLVVPLGATVEFPNSDPWFHNVFSLFEGKRFDLGLYEAGTARKVHFDRPGISYVFCDIHPQMSAVVIVLNTPFYRITSGDGPIQIVNVPPGRYRLHVWNEATLPEHLNSLSREISVSKGNHSLGTIRLVQAGDLLLNHRNKYGREYDNPDPSNPVYSER